MGFCKPIVISAAIILYFTKANGQSSWPAYLKDSGNHIIEVIKDDNIKLLAEMMPYPISVGYPPVIYTQAQFIERYKDLFDSLSREFRKHKKVADDSDFESFGRGVSFLNLFTLCGYGTIKSIDRLPQNASSMIKAWEIADRKSIYKDLKKFESNLIMCTNQEYRFRIDRDSLGLRLALWSKDSGYSSPPLDVLFSRSNQPIYQGSLGLLDCQFYKDDKVIKIYENLSCGGKPDTIWYDVIQNGVRVKHLECKTLK